LLQTDMESLGFERLLADRAPERSISRASLVLRIEAAGSRSAPVTARIASMVSGITPHNAYNTTEAVGRIIGTTMENIEAFARGEPRNVVA
jgi:hypothetical protein